MERLTKVESLQEIIAETAESAGTGEKTSQNDPPPAEHGNEADQRFCSTTQIDGFNCWLLGGRNISSGMPC
jgi:hypothetical protein